jgi:hypothetical protein
VIWALIHLDERPVEISEGQLLVGLTARVWKPA